MTDPDYRLGDLILELVYHGKQVAGMVVPVRWEVLDAGCLMRIRMEHTIVSKN